MVVQEGSHAQLRHPERGGRVTVAGLEVSGEPVPEELAPPRVLAVTVAA
ncbi:MAG: type II toxin-antitoxin system HicA family toxin [Actinomycetota bacterium]|nr:type II toxin-antitoxin system HicA family toxin [Actinomycetota bacterium]